LNVYPSFKPTCRLTPYVRRPPASWLWTSGYVASRPVIVYCRFDVNDTDVRRPSFCVRIAPVAVAYDLFVFSP
jgi:hypothetical protein